MLDSDANGIHGSGRETVARLNAVLLCDLAESTALIERLGDAAAAELIRNHDRIARDCLHRHGGREIDKTDGFLMLFERPIQAVAFALDYQHALRGLAQQTGQPLRSRVGIHVGEVLLWNNAAADIADGAKPVEVEGLAKAIAARMMSLARPGQILLSETAFGLAQRARHELGSSGERLRWLNHGRYRLKGMDVPLPVFEVGEAGAAPLLPPPSAAKAKRLLPWWRTRWAQAALLLVALSIPLAMLMRPQPAIAFAERDWVVVASLRNMTSYSTFDGALDVAVRVALEQSRYVNLVPNLQVRETLRRMKHDPASPIDDRVASAVALREGARAVVVPTVSEVGGRVRFTAELVDPSTGATVYGTFADADNETGALTALDTAMASLRAELGESLSAIEHSSRPTEIVTTPNLDALRAFSLALDAKLQQRYTDSRVLAEQALQLDPQFAMARLHMASLALIESDDRGFEEHLRIAEGLVDRLSLRESLLMQASRANFGSTSDMLAAWKRLSDLFPDEQRSHYNHAVFAMDLANDPERAITAIAPLLDGRSYYRGLAPYEGARARLALGDIDAALALFRKANADGLTGNGVEFAVALAMEGDTEGAHAVLDNSARRTDGEQLQAWLTKLGLLIMQQRWDQVPLLLSAAEPADASPAIRDTYRFVRLAVAAYQAPMDAEGDLQGYVDEQLAMLDTAGAGARGKVLFRALAGYWLGVRQRAAGDWRPPPSAIERVQQLRQDPLTDLLSIVEAEQHLRNGQPELAAQRLVGRVRGTELYLLHAVLQRAWLAQGADAKAADECRWLRNNRTRAFVEVGALWLLVPLNVLEGLAATVPRADLDVSARSCDRLLSAEEPGRG